MNRKKLIGFPSFSQETNRQTDKKETNFDAITARVEFVEGANAERSGCPELVLGEGLGDGDGGAVDGGRRRNRLVIGTERRGGDWPAPEAARGGHGSVERRGGGGGKPAIPSV